MFSSSDAWRTASVTLRACLSPEGRRDALRKGFDPAERIEVTLTPEDAEWPVVAEFYLPDTEHGDAITLDVNREWMIVTAHTDLRPDQASQPVLDTLFGVLVHNRPTAFVSWGAAKPLDEFPATGSELVALEAAHQSEAFDALEIKTQSLTDLDALWCTWATNLRNEIGARCQEWDGELNPRIQSLMLEPTTQRLRALTSSFDPQTATDATVAALVGAFNEVDERREEIRAEIASHARRKAEKAAAIEWIEQHGTDRLRKAVALDLLDKSMAIYRDHRLLIERPDWAWLHDRDDLRDIHNPSEAALDALLAARELDPHARVQWQNSSDGTKGREVVISSFLGRPIITGVPGGTERAIA